MGTSQLALKERAINSLREGLAKLGQPQSGVPLGHIAALAAGCAELALTIDFTASTAIGAPVVFVDRHPVRAPVSLTRRQREIAMWIAEGLSNPEIARRAGLALSTVKDHVHHILEKTGLASRAAIAAAVSREAL